MTDITWLARLQVVRALRNEHGRISKLVTVHRSSGCDASELEAIAARIDDAATSIQTSARGLIKQ